MKTRNKRKKRISEILLDICVGLSIVFIIWFFASWIDTGFHNDQPNPVYQEWNLFALAF